MIYQKTHIRYSENQVYKLLIWFAIFIEPGLCSPDGRRSHAYGQVVHQVSYCILDKWSRFPWRNPCWRRSLKRLSWKSQSPKSSRRNRRRRRRRSQKIILKRSWAIFWGKQRRREFETTTKGDTLFEIFIFNFQFFFVGLIQ